MATNSWNSGFAVTSADFLSLDDTIAIGPRQADGSLPVSDFLHLAGTSSLIDRGTNVGLAYAGSAPDLGAFETSIPEPASAGLIGVLGLFLRRRCTGRPA
ncbi:MAG: hypothetical protein QM754_18725 [Tepidisphaeraceae bacterium]